MHVVLTSPLLTTMLFPSANTHTHTHIYKQMGYYYNELSPRRKAR